MRPEKRGFYRYDMKDDERTIQRYFEDPAISGSVTKEVYDELALTYDKIYDDYSLLKILLIVTIVIAIILLVILLVVVFTRGPGKRAAAGMNWVTRRTVRGAAGAETAGGKGRGA